MKKQLVIICVCVAALQNVSAAKWEPSTHECSLMFPAADWTMQDGGEINHVRVILNAVNRTVTKGTHGHHPRFQRYGGNI